MDVPDPVLREVAAALGGDAVTAEGRVGGGCIHPAAKIRSASGETFFLKWSPEPGPVGFAEEARGLAALRARGPVPVPAVIAASGGGAAGHGWLLLEWIEPGARTAASPRTFGRELARLHRPIEGGRPGWEEDGWIGPLPQSNPSELDWPTFWARARVEAQWRRAREEGRIGRGEEARMELCLSRIDEILDGWESDGISLLHGDLWSGNVLVGPGGAHHLIDPAVYRGHREVDLAMMDLFGGFEPAVFAAYREAAPLRPGYAELRMPLYQLYPLLVHVNLFGGGYRDRALAALRSAVAAFG